MGNNADDRNVDYEEGDDEDEATWYDKKWMVYRGALPLLLCFFSHIFSWKGWLQYRMKNSITLTTDDNFIPGASCQHSPVKLPDHNQGR